MESSQRRIEESQSRLELQLQEVLTSQQRRGTPLLSQSLDASSPAGRQTWMELGRLLRDEGITPDVIQKNKMKFIAAMKQAVAESVPESFHTASESFSVKNNVASLQSHAISSLSFGTAPPSCTGFPDSFLERDEKIEKSLDAEENITNGMDNLMLGMDQSILANHHLEKYDSDDELGDLSHELAGQELAGQELEDNSLYLRWHDTDCPCRWHNQLCV